MNPLKAIGLSVVRTIVPAIVAVILTAALRLKVNLDARLVTEAVELAVFTLYYAGVRLLEEKVAPAWGRLLGYARAPKYTGGES